MRRWTLTGFLVGAATAAAVLAPRLVADNSGPEVISAPQLLGVPEVVTVPPDPTVNVIVRPPPVAAPVVTALIPELGVPVEVEKAPEVLDPAVDPGPPEGYANWDEFWEDCPVCGMG